MGSKPIHSEDQVRQAQRRAVDQPTRLRPNSWSSLEVTMIDLSEFGFRAGCDARLRAGGCVTLDVPGVGSVEAQVEWQRGNEFGARFLEPISLDACDWDLCDGGSALAHLLVQRAAASQAGRGEAEAQLRRQILSALPMRKSGAAA
jgi:hypothetical protein